MTSFDYWRVGLCDLFCVCTNGDMTPWSRAAVFCKHSHRAKDDADKHLHLMRTRKLAPGIRKAFNDHAKRQATGHATTLRSGTTGWFSRHVAPRRHATNRMASRSEKREVGSLRSSVAVQYESQWMIFEPIPVSGFIALKDDRLRSFLDVQSS